MGQGCRPYIIADMSANHGHSLETALRIVEAAAVGGADAIKLQTFTAETLTFNADTPNFTIPSDGNPWGGMRLWDLYQEASMPWEWHEPLFRRARDLGLGCISTAFDASSVAFLSELDIDAYKIASFELINLSLLRCTAATGKPVIVSTGMGTLDEIAEAVATVRDAGNNRLALLKCTSAYPTAISDCHLATIPDLLARFSCPVGLSDHTLGNTAVQCAVALGACVIEKHLTLDRAAGGPDADFSLEPHEFKAMSALAHEAFAALGAVHYGPTPSEAASHWERPSIHVVRDVAEGSRLSAEDIRIIRPGGGMLPKFYDSVIGRRARTSISAGKPLLESMIDHPAGQS